MGCSHFAKMKMWKPCKSNLNSTGEITLALRSHSTPREMLHKCGALFNTEACLCTWSRVRVWAAPSLSFVTRSECTMKDYQFHAQLDWLAWTIPAAHTAILLSQSLLPPAGPISAGPPCCSSSYWEKDWKWENRLRGHRLAKGRERRQGGQGITERRMRGWQRSQASERNKLWT